jgi:hypothetical protein
MYGNLPDAHLSNLVPLTLLSAEHMLVGRTVAVQSGSHGAIRCARQEMVPPFTHKASRIKSGTEASSSPRSFVPLCRLSLMLPPLLRKKKK